MVCDRLIFCGYSFPDADIHVRYLLKRMEVNRRRGPEVFVANEHKGKRDEARQGERERYTRFFRDKLKVHWTRMGFEQFAADPDAAYDPSNWVP